MADLDSVLRQIEKPIRYAAADRYHNLPVVRDLGRFVSLHLTSVTQDLSPDRTLDLNDLRDLFAKFDQAPLDRRKASLSHAMMLIDRLRGKGDASPPIDWSTPIQYVKGIGPRRGDIFNRLGIRTLEDLVLFIPWRYEDRSVLCSVNRLRVGEVQTIQGRVMTADVVRTRRRGFTIFEAAVEDGTGVIVGKWFNQAFLKKSLIKDRLVLLSGIVKANPHAPGGLEMINPQYELPADDDEETLHAGRIVPIYHETRGLTSRQLRRILRHVLDDYTGRIGDALPERMRASRDLLPYGDALAGVHFPPPGSDLERLNGSLSPFHRRLAYEEFLLLGLGLSLKKRAHSRQGEGIRMAAGEGQLDTFRASLPFRMTPGQEKAIGDVLRDMGGNRPMHRLIQGDVGCGKTTVALAAMYVATRNGAQAALMAPTEILAVQHYVTLKDQAASLGLRVALVTGGRRTKPRSMLLSQVGEGKVDIVVGTHALISEKVVFRRLGLAVVDEQHKFGVAQRLAFSGKGPAPHVLIMTATPIPRTLALTVYGDLDITLIPDLPPGRSPVDTRIVEEGRRSSVYDLLEQAMASGHQGYVVYPLVEDSEDVDLKAAVRMANHLKRDVFAHRRVDLLHGRMKTDEKESVMTAFKRGKLDLLVTTSIIEVGVDVPNATIMVVEHAERFGLAQLHQLRGRVGRGSHRSVCILMAGRRVTEDGRRRLNALVRSRDGFAIAEEDLAIRGPGEFFGTRQSGLPELRIANILRDAALLEEARSDAESIANSDPGLDRPEHRDLREALVRKWEGKLKWASAG